MLLHVHRDSPPFRTTVVSTAEEPVTVGFAPEVGFESEGTRKVLRPLPRHRDPDGRDAARSQLFALGLGRTTFERSRELAILTVVLTPREPGSEESELTEFDVIKLVKLWQRGEGVAGAPSAITEGRDVWFTAEPPERASLGELVRRSFPGWQPLVDEQAPCKPGVASAAPRSYRVGTVHLELPPREWRHQLFCDIAALKRRREPPIEAEAWDRAVAVGGVLQGLLDFRRIEPDELADVFAEVDIAADDETMRAFHKGTLLFISAEPEDELEPNTADGEPGSEVGIGIDPYLAVPNVVLLHDEERLRRARLCERRLSERQSGPLRDRVGIGETENGLNQMATLLAQALPNVFHYSSERRLQKRGRASRGLDDLETLMRRRMDDLSSVLELRVRSRDRWTNVLGIAVGVVTAFLVQQAIEGRPLWIIVGIALSLFAVFFFLRDRLF